MRGSDLAFIRSADVPGLSLVRGLGVDVGVSRHAHASLCFGLVEQGRRVLCLDHARHAAEGGDVLAVSPGRVHSIRQDGPCSFVMFSLAPEAMRQALARLLAPGDGPLHFPAPVLRDAALFQSLLQLALCLQFRSAALETQGVFLESLALLVRHADALPALPEVCSDAVVRARALLRERFTENISLADLAGQCGVDPWSLCRAFSAQVGLPPHAFQNHLRLALAKEMLARGASLAETAAAAGFFDQSHLHRHFLRLVGLTPGRFAAAFR